MPLSRIFNVENICLLTLFVKIKILAKISEFSVLITFSQMTLSFILYRYERAGGGGVLFIDTIQTCFYLPNKPSPYNK